MDQKSKIVEELTEEIAQLILESKKALAETKEGKGIQKDLKGLKEKIVALESRLEKHIKNFEIVATEVERLVTEKVEGMNKETDKKITYLQGQIGDLKTAITRLSNGLKKMKEVLGLPR